MRTYIIIRIGRLEIEWDSSYEREWKPDVIKWYMGNIFVWFKLRIFLKKRKYVWS